MATFFIDRPIFAAVISVMIVLAGGIAVMLLPVAQYPEITPPTVQVTCTYPGASGKVVAETVAAPIEQQVIGVENMLYMSSQSHQRRRLQPDGHVRGRHESRHGPGARAKPREFGAAHPARRGQADRRQREEEIAQYFAGRQSHLAQGNVRSALPEQLRHDSPARRIGPGQRRGRCDLSGAARLQHACLARPESDGRARFVGQRRVESPARTKRAGGRRFARPPAGAARAGVSIHAQHAGPAGRSGSNSATSSSRPAAMAD